MEDKVKELEEQLGAAILREASFKAKIEELESAAEITNAAVEQAIKERDEANAALKKEVEVANSVTKSEVPTKPAVPTEQFKVDNVSYVFKVATFYFEGEKVMASDALKNKKLLAELVKRGVVGIFEKV